MRSATANLVLSAAKASLDDADPLVREWAQFVVDANRPAKPLRTAPARVLPTEDAMPYTREILHARDEFYDPQDAIKTEPAELDEARRSTDAGGLIGVALMAAVIFGVPFAVWLWRGTMQ